MLSSIFKELILRFWEKTKIIFKFLHKHYVDQILQVDSDILLTKATFAQVLFETSPLFGNRTNPVESLKSVISDVI